MNKIYYIAFFICCIILISSCGSENPPTDFNEGPCPDGITLEDIHLLLGNPSGAETNENMPENYLMKMDEYAISYSRSRAIPNWVSWYLSDEWYKDGDGERQDDFRANPFLPSNWDTPNSGSYTNSGFDRGHNCPSADRLCSNNYNSATFFMTNMIPQAPFNNQEVWKHWECYLRYLADRGNELYIVMGNYGQGGDGSFGYKDVIVDDGLEITVPASIWKVAIVIPKGDGNDIEAIDAQTTIIAVDIPNSQQAGNFDFDDPQFMTTVDDIEEKMGVGFDLFSNLPSNVQDALESDEHVVDASYNTCW
jgi:endonuclease G